MTSFLCASLQETYPRDQNGTKKICQIHLKCLVFYCTSIKKKKKVLNAKAQYCVPNKCVRHKLKSRGMTQQNIFNTGMVFILSPYTKKECYNVLEESLP